MKMKKTRARAPPTLDRSIGLRTKLCWSMSEEGVKLDMDKIVVETEELEELW